MSTFNHHLRRQFSTATATTFNNPSIKTLSQDLYKERDLKKLVHKFKLYSGSDRFRAKSGIYENTVRRLASAKRFQWIQEILEYQTQFTQEVSKENFNVRLIKLYGQSRMFDNAEKVFDEIPQRGSERTVKSVNALLSASVNSGRFEEMERLFGEMEGKLGVKPDLVSFNILVKGFCEKGEFDKAVGLVGTMGKNGVKMDLITFNTLFDQLYKNGKFEDGERMWKRMSESEFVPNIRSYNARVVGLVKEKMFEEALEFVGEMGRNGVKPDIFTYGAVIRGYCGEGELNEVKKWYGEMVRSGCEPNRAIVGTVLSCACDQADYDWCFELCKELFERKSLVDVKLLQKAVDRLVEGSRIEEAKKVIEMGKSNDYYLYKLQLGLESSLVT